MAHSLEFAYLKQGEFDFSGWLSTREKKASEWTIRFFVLKGVYLAAYQGPFEGHAGIGGPLKQVPDGFTPDFEWLQSICDSDSNISGGSVIDGEGLEFSLSKNRRRRKNIHISLRAENEESKKKWMEMLNSQLGKIKAGEIKKPKEKDVTHAMASGSCYSPMTGQVDMDALKAQALEEMNYIELLFSRFVDAEQGAKGINKEGFQELLISLGLGQGLSDEELQALVKSEFEQADTSGGGEVEFKEFINTYNRLVELQKEKVKKREPESAKEYIAGKSSSEINLTPQNAREGPVINAKWVHESKYSLLLRENVHSWSGDDFTCRDATNKVVIKCEGKAASAGSDIKGYDATTGDLLFHLEEIYFRVTKTFLIKDPRGKVIATLRRKFFSMRPDITVYDGAATFNWRGNTRNRLMYQLDGSFIQWQFQIRNARGETVAFADEKLASNTFASIPLVAEKNTYQLEVAPGVDASLMAAMAIACDCAVND